MAKKGHAKKGAHAKAVAAPQKKSSTVWWIVGAVALVIILILLVRSGRQGVPEQPVVTPPTTPTEQPPVAPAIPFKLEVQNYCEAPLAIGAKPEFCEKTATGIKVLVTHYGAAKIEGLKYYVLDIDKNVLSEGTLSTPMEGATKVDERLVGVEQMYNVDFTATDAASVELRAIGKVVENERKIGIYSETGALKECLNQRAFQPMKLCK